MIEVIRERWLRARPEDLWLVIDDPARMAGWLAFAERIEILEGSGAGRRQRLYGRWGKKRSEIDQVVTDYEPGRLLAWRHEAERLDGKPAPRFARETRFAIRLRPEGEGTRVVLEARQQPAGAVKGLALRIFGARQTARRMECSLDRLASAAARPPSRS